MALGLVKALVLAQATFAPHYTPAPVHTVSEAITAFYEQWRETSANPSTLETWQKELTGKLVGDRWVLYRGGRDRLQIDVDAATGRLKSVIVID